MNKQVTRQVVKALVQAGRRDLAVAMTPRVRAGVETPRATKKLLLRDQGAWFVCDQHEKKYAPLVKRLGRVGEGSGPVRLTPKEKKEGLACDFHLNPAWEKKAFKKLMEQIRLYGEDQ